MQPRFEQFIREQQYLVNVTPATVPWYEMGLQMAFHGIANGFRPEESCASYA
jgi:hypothetical protein